MIEEGDGKFAHRLSQGRCPKCEAALPELNQIYWPVRCTVCDLEISMNREPCAEEDESLAMGAGALR